MIDNEFALEQSQVGARPRLRWGIKASLISYLRSLDDGTCTTEDGAVIDERSSFVFPAAEDSTYDASTGRGILKFGGAVLLGGHGGMLQIAVSAPWVEFHSEETLLTMASIDSDTAALSRFPLAVLTPPGRVSVEGLQQEIQAALAPEGVAVFNYQYLSGEPLDPLQVVY